MISASEANNETINLGAMPEADEKPSINQGAPAQPPPVPPTPNYLNHHVARKVVVLASDSEEDVKPNVSFACFQ